MILIKKVHPCRKLSKDCNEVLRGVITVKQNVKSMPLQKTTANILNGVSPKFNIILLHIKFGQITKKCRDKAKSMNDFPDHIMQSFRNSLRAVTNVISSLSRYREIISQRSFHNFQWVFNTLKSSNLILYRVNNGLIRLCTFNLLLLFTLCRISRRLCQTRLVNSCEMESHVLVINTHFFKMCKVISR